jgi:peroxiredoxin
MASMPDAHDRLMPRLHEDHERLVARPEPRAALWSRTLRQEEPMPQSNELVAALERATERAIALNAPLRDRLKVIADEVRALSTEFAEAVDGFVRRLQAAEAGAQAPAVGDLLPDFLLPDQSGRLVGLGELLETGPAVVAFLRGHWCPYCQTTAVALGEIADAAAAQGARIVAIAPENRKYTERLAADSGGRLPILTDVDNGYALALNLAIWVDDDMAKLILSAGWDVPSYKTSADWLLPIPATFVIDRSARVVARYVNADYRTRMELADILAALKALPQASVAIAE